MRRDELFSLDVNGRRYYLATLLPAESEPAAAGCRAPAGATDSEKANFLLRKDGALGGTTVTVAIGAGKLAGVLTLSEAHADERGGQSSTPRSILDMAGMLKARKGINVSVEDMNPWR